MAMAAAGERLSGIDGYSLWTARIGRTGNLKLIEDHTILQFADKDHWPMDWLPKTMDEVMTFLAGGPVIIAVRDKVT